MLVFLSFYACPAAAVVFYFSFEANMIILTWVLPQYPSDQRPSDLAYYFRQFCVFVGTADLILFVALSLAWSDHQTLIAICEWSVCAVFMPQYF